MYVCMNGWVCKKGKERIGRLDLDSQWGARRNNRGRKEGGLKEEKENMSRRRRQASQRRKIRVKWQWTLSSYSGFTSVYPSPPAQATGAVIQMRIALSQAASICHRWQWNDYNYHKDTSSFFFAFFFILSLRTKINSTTLSSMINDTIDPVLRGNPN